jgi:hypothetical protein
MSTVNAGHPGGQPVLTVSRGRATPAEVAAVVAVLLSVRAAAAPAGEPAMASRWAEGSRTRAVFPRPGPHSWRASALPR